jgi:hypothetical protein
VKDWLWAWGSSGERRDGALGPVEAGSVDCQPVVEGKARVAAARIAYGTHQRKKGERMAAATGEVAETGQP